MREVPLRLALVTVSNVFEKLQRPTKHLLEGNDKFRFDFGLCGFSHEAGVDSWNRRYEAAFPRAGTSEENVTTPFLTVRSRDPIPASDSA